MVELILAIHAALTQAGLRHAFGGALALGYVAAPRGTADIDVNVFAPLDQLDAVKVALKPIGFTYDEPAGPPIAGFRFAHRTEPFPLDVFPSLDPRYEIIAKRVEHHRFGPDANRLPFLSAEDLCVFKLSFGRPQDWVDLQAIATARPELDVDYVEEQVIGLRGVTMYPRVARLRSLFRA